MNYRQLFVSSNHEEQLEILYQMLQTIEDRKHKLVIANGRLIHNRRGVFRGAHFLNDKRGRFPRSRIIAPLTFLSTLIIVSAVAMLAFIHAPAHISAPIMFFYITSLWAVVAFKPNRLALRI